MSIRIGPAIMAAGMSMTIASIITTHALAAPVVPAGGVHVKVELEPTTVSAAFSESRARDTVAMGPASGVRPTGKAPT